MNVLLLGATGFMGPHVARALAPHHRLRITDVKPAPAEMRREFAGHEFREVDVTDARQVLDAARGTDAIVNLAVVRQDPVLAFRVNTLGCLHMMQAAVALGIRRVINTGPHFSVAGPCYTDGDYGIVPEAPPHPGCNLYALSKSLGQEICREFAQQHEIYVQTYLFCSLRDAAQLQPGAGGVPFVVSWRDAAETFRLGLAIEIDRLPSRCEVFFILGDAPQGKFDGRKARTLLGLVPRDDTTVLWKRRSGR